MAKKKSKSKETVILIRLPEMETRKGEGTMTVQRGDLGHIHQFNYTGLTVRGNIAEALQTAFIALAKLEAAPPPEFSSPQIEPAAEIEDNEPANEEEETEGEEENTDSTDTTDTDDSPDTGEEDEEAEIPETEIIEIEVRSQPNEVSSPAISRVPTDPQAQMSLF
ncbi:MAG: hypothetical protein K8I82_00010 [Anaerolineae bacterium]|nr:hypothetical protein [Anaerolineae bacterium]